MNYLMVPVKFGIFFFTAFLVTKFLTLAFGNLLKEAGFVRPNYRGELIPVGSGIVFYIALALVAVTGRSLGLFEADLYIFLFTTGVMALFGLIDDVFGSRQASGLSGHLKQLLVEGEVTTGALKAMAGGFAAIAAGLEMTSGSIGVVQFLINVLIIALSTNAVNLLDLRPGRAGKGFLLVSLILVITGLNYPQIFYLATLMGSLIAFLPHDLNARVMMGDAGSNTLGFTLGYTAVSLPLEYKVTALVMLIGLHAFTEKYSLTKIIEQNKFLNYIDMLGRGSE